MKTVYATGIGPGKCGTDRNRPRGDYQVIEGLPPFFPFRDRPDKDTAVLQIDLGDFMQDTGIDAVFIPKFFRRDRYELPDIVDNLADIIGNASGRVGCMGSFLEGYDVQVRLQPFCLGRRAHSGGIPADDNKSFLCHISFTSIQVIITRFPRKVICMAEYKLLTDGCQRERKTVITLTLTDKTALPILLPMDMR
jgi:hypothetical protein